MTDLKRFFCLGTLITFGAAGAYAQVSSINALNVQARVFNDVPGATVQTMNFYPTVFSFTETAVSAPTGFANRDVWRFSNNGGLSPYAFADSDYFSATTKLVLRGDPITPRKEAGWLLSSSSVGDIQFIVNTDGHEVVQFGGISFYSFNANNGLTYNSGDMIELGMKYFVDGNGRNALQFTANGINSPVFEFGIGTGIGSGSTFGSYFQIVNDPTNPSNAGQAIWQDMSIVAVPEPSVLALLGLGGIAVLLRRKA
jgi:hypothetical protein